MAKIKSPDRSKPKRPGENGRSSVVKSRSQVKTLKSGLLIKRDAVSGKIMDTKAAATAAFNGARKEGGAVFAERPPLKPTTRVIATPEPRMASYADCLKVGADIRRRFRKTLDALAK